MSVDAYDTAYVCPQISHYIALDHTLSYCIILYHTISYDLSIFMISYTIKRYPNIFLNISKVVHYISKYLIISHNISKHFPFSRSLSISRALFPYRKAQIIQRRANTILVNLYILTSHQSENSTILHDVVVASI